MKAVTFGEIMLRLAPEGYLRFVQADHFGAVYGGGEANVAVSLANYGVNSVFVTKLPRHEIGQAALNSLRRFGVDTSRIARGGDRLGVRKLKFSQGLSALFNAVEKLIPLCLLLFNGCFELRAFPGERPELVFILRGRNFPFQIFDFPQKRGIGSGGLRHELALKLPLLVF